MSMSLGLSLSRQGLLRLRSLTTIAYKTFQLSQTIGQRYSSKMAYDHFGHDGQADYYAQYRPKYPSSFKERIIQEAQSTSKELLVDICTGSGQVIHNLHTYFKTVRGFDRSLAQISSAPKYSNVEFAQADALDIPLPDKCVDVVTIGQGMHWLPVDDFLKKTVLRLLRPNGVFVVMGYGVAKVLNSPEAAQVFDDYYASLDDYWDCDRHALDTAHSTVDFEAAGFQKPERFIYGDPIETSIENFEGYLRSWSAYRTYLVKNPEAKCDHLADCIARLRELCGPTIKHEYPYFQIIARPR